MDRRIIFIIEAFDVKLVSAASESPSSPPIRRDIYFLRRYLPDAVSSRHRWRHYRHALAQLIFIAAMQQERAPLAARYFRERFYF